jgi:ATP-binding cassette subfamily F protein 3
MYKAFGGQVLFNDVSFHLNPGERIGVVGRNGHGKTTLFNMIAGLDFPDEGEISFPKNYTVGYLDQNVRFSRKTLLEEACLGLPPELGEETWRCEKILAGLGFSVQDMDKPPEIFSGGFQLRINLAKTLVSSPGLLLLDEPTNFLDIVSIRWMIRFLKTWRGEVMLISHDRHFMDSVATHVLGIHRQKARKVEGKTGKFFDQIQKEEEIHEKTRIHEEKKRKQEEEFINKFRAKARLAGLVQSRIKTLEKRTKFEKLEKIKTLSFSFRSETFQAKNLLQAHNLSFTYNESQARLISDFSLSIGSGERVAVIGKNGKGKSTLIKLLAEALSPRSGTLSRHPLLKVDYYEQSNVDQLNPLHTVEEEILFADPEGDRQRARDVCGAMMFEGDQALKKISVLSGGEKSRVCLGKLIVSPCHLLLLDEPTNHLDPESCEALMEAIRKFEGAVVIVTHNERFLQSIPNRLVVFDRGTHTLFESGYRDFLQEVGWSSEETLKPVSIKEKTAVHNRRELKRKKAEMVQEKSRALRGLREKMSKLESGIEELEKEIHEVNQKLMQDATEKRGKDISDLSKRLHQLQIEVEAKYLQLNRFTIEYEDLEEKYRERLESI